VVGAQELERGLGTAAIFKDTTVVAAPYDASPKFQVIDGIGLREWARTRAR
jgi:hypothetical protein